jgi:hypothetical protein
MKNRVIVNLILLLMIASVCANTRVSAEEAAKPDTSIASAVTAGTPGLEVPEWYFNFGEVKEGADYRHEFVVRNAGTGVLEIRKVQPG